jgi:hypothetical protein
MILIFYHDDLAVYRARNSSIDAAAFVEKLID